MAENKKSFLLYSDLIFLVEKMVLKDRKNKTNNSGELLYHILRYVNDIYPEPINDAVEFAFEPIKQQLKRDLVKWDSTKSARSVAGKRSAEIKRIKKEQASTKSTNVKSVQQTSTKSTNVKSVQQTPTKSTVSVSVNVNDSVSVKQTKIAFELFYNLYAYKVGGKKAKAKWDRLPLKTQELIISYLPKYVNATNLDGSYPSRRHPTTFLNNDTWLDEIPENKHVQQDKNVSPTPYANYG